MLCVMYLSISISCTPKQHSWTLVIMNKFLILTNSVCVCLCARVWHAAAFLPSSGTYQRVTEDQIWASIHQKEILSVFFHLERVHSELLFRASLLAHLGSQWHPIPNTHEKCIRTIHARNTNYNSTKQESIVFRIYTATRLQCSSNRSSISYTLECIVCPTINHTINNLEKIQPSQFNYSLMMSKAGSLFNLLQVTL